MRGMVFALRNMARTMVVSLHRRLFGHTMGAYMKQFLKHLSLSLVGLTLANGVLFGTILLAGRLLGPEQLGMFSFTLAMAQVLVIPMMLGMDVAVMRSVARHAGKLKDARRIVSSGFLVMGVSLPLVALLIAGLAGALSSLFGVETAVWRMAVVLAIALAFRMFFDGVIRGEGKFKFQSVARVAEALVVLTSFTVLYWLVDGGGHRLFLLATVIGVAVISILYLTGGGAGRLIAWRYGSRPESLRLWRYIRFGMIGSVAGLLMVGGDKLLIERLLGQVSLGVYAAYYFISVQLATQLNYMFINVFFPMVSGYKDKLAVLKKVDRLARLALVPAALVIMGEMAASLYLLSDAYLFSWALILSMSVYATLYFIWQTYWWFIASTGAAGVRFTSLHGLMAGAAYLLAIRFLASKFDLLAPALSFFIVFAYLSAVIGWWKKRYTRKFT